MHYMLKARIDTAQTTAERIQVLEQIRDELEHDMVSIRAQINEANGTRAATGEYADPVWYQKVHSALKFKGAEHQKILRLLSECRRTARQEADKTWERTFITVAKRRLSADLFAEILSEVKALTGKA